MWKVVIAVGWSDVVFFPRMRHKVKIGMTSLRGFLKTFNMLRFALLNPLLISTTLLAEGLLNKKLLIINIHGVFRVLPINKNC